MVRWSLRLKINLTVNVLVYCVLTTVFTFYYFCIFDFFVLSKILKTVLNCSHRCRCTVWTWPRCWSTRRWCWRSTPSTVWKKNCCLLSEDLMLLKRNQNQALMDTLLLNFFFWGNKNGLVYWNCSVLISEKDTRRVLKIFLVFGHFLCTHWWTR